MASQIRFDPPDVSGLVAAGTTLSAAAERLGVAIALSCGGKGECTSCAIEILSNPFSLSDVTDAERQMLGADRVASSIRLGCQAYIRDGDCVARVIGHAEPQQDDSHEQRKEAGQCTQDPLEDVKSRILEAFGSLPTSEQVSTAIELQVKVAGEFLESIADQPLKVGEQILNSIFGQQTKPSVDDEQPADTTKKDE